MADLTTGNSAYGIGNPDRVRVSSESATELVDLSALKSDTVPIPLVRRIYVGGAGAVKVTTLSGVVVTYAAVPAGTYLNVACVSLLWSTGTTATVIVGEI